MGWIKFESFQLGCPDFADVITRREAAEHLQSARKIVCRQKVVEMYPQLVMAVEHVTVGLVLRSSTVARLRHLRTVLGLIP